MCNKLSVVLGFCLVWLGCFSDAATALPSASHVSVEAFASLPNISQMRLSPDGQHVSYLKRIQNEQVGTGTALMIYSPEQGEAQQLTWASDREYQFNWMRWVSNNKLLVSARFVADRYGTPTMETRMAVLDIHSRKIQNVVPNSVTGKLSWVPQIQDRVIDLIPSDPEHILVAMDLVSPTLPTVYKINLETRSRKVVRPHRKKIRSWMTDQQHQVRLGIEFNGMRYKIRHFPLNKRKSKVLWQFEALSLEQVLPLGFGLDPNILYVQAYHEDRLALFKVSLDDPTLTKELVYSDPNYDVEGSLFYSAATGKPVGIKTVNDRGYVFWDPQYKVLQESINRALPDTINRIIGFSRDERKYLLLSTSDTESGVYALGDRAENSLLPIAQRYPELPSELMSPVKPVTYHSRDGQEIEAFLTIPRGSSGKKLPTIIFPHGGPISSSSNDFDYWPQFFASRGYAVLQMNFRGSSGYGYDFMRAGLQQWGKIMQDDVEDGLVWLVDSGIADPDRVCIVGASYGGYAALMGVATSNRYRCAVSFAGISDVSLLVQSKRTHLNYDVAKAQIGSDFKELREYSPISRIADIDVPVLLVHGTKDRSVGYQQSKLLYKELAKAGKDVTYIEQEGGDHNLSKENNRIEFFQAMDDFLRQHLPSQL